MVTYVEIKTEYVIETLGKCQKVILCDFSSMRMLDCDNLTVSAINNFINKGTAKFFKVVSG